MSYVSFTFLVFMLVCSILYYALPKSWRPYVLLTASYVFYFLSSKSLIVFMLATTLLIYIGGILIGKLNDEFKLKKSSLEKPEIKILKEKTAKKKRMVVTITVLLNFGILAFLKYFNFFGESINSIFGTSVSTLNLALPLGISYYTLQATSYVIDVYRGKIKADKNLGRLALFVSFFPQIVEGPIGKYDQLAPQLYEGHSFDHNNVVLGLQLVLWGLFKKMVIADRIAMPVNEIFGDSEYSGLVVIAAIIFYTIQIYAEFSGCMDIVRGCARIFGVDLAKNFERPFFSRSIAEFWRRWHITLGAWLRDYIFYSVSLSKGFLKLNKNAKKHMNAHFANFIPMSCALFFVWFGNGIWHGAGWKYIVYGLYYYVIMMLAKFFEPVTNKVLEKLKIDTSKKLYKLWQIIRTSILVCFGMLIFRADTLTQAKDMFMSIGRNFTFSVLSDGTFLNFDLNVGDYVILALSIALMFAISVFQEKGHSIRAELCKQNIIIRWIAYFALLFTIIIFGVYGEGYNVGTFIYGQF